MAPSRKTVLPWRPAARSSLSARSTPVTRSWASRPSMRMAFTTLMPSGTTSASLARSSRSTSGSFWACIIISGLAVTTNSRSPESMARSARWAYSSAVPPKILSKYSVIANNIPSFLFGLRRLKTLSSERVLRIPKDFCVAMGGGRSRPGAHWGVFFRPQAAAAGSVEPPPASVRYFFLALSRSRSSSKSYRSSLPKAAVLSEAFKNTVMVWKISLKSCQML